MHEINLLSWQRDTFLYAILEDIITHGVCEYIEAGTLTDKEGLNVLRLARHQLGTPGLFNKYLQEDVMNQTILYKAPNETIPTEVVESVCKEFNGSICYAAVVDGEIVTMQEIGPPKIEKVKENFQNFMDYGVIAIMSKDKAKTPAPVTILQVKDKPQVVGFFQGDLSCTDKMITKLQKERRAAEDFDSFWAEIGTNNDTVNEICNTLAINTFMMLLNTTADIWTYDPYKMETDTSWGSVVGEPAPNGGGTEVPTQIAAADNTKKTPSFSSSSAQPAQIAAADSGTDPRADGIKKYPRPDKVPMAKFYDSVSKSVMAVNFPLTEPWTRCPETINGKKVDKTANKKWHEDNIGKIPTNWSDKPLMPAHMLLSNKMAAADIKAGDASAAALAAKDTATKNIPLSPKLDKHLVDDFVATMAKFFGSNSEEIANPLKIRDNEKDLIPIAQAIGKTSTKDMAAPWQVRLALAKEHPEVVARLLGDWQIRATDFEQRNGELEQRILELEEAASKPKTPKFGSSK